MMYLTKGQETYMCVEAAFSEDSLRHGGADHVQRGFAAFAAPSAHDYE